LPTLAIAFWMTVITGVVVALAAVLFESARWRWPSPTVQVAIAYNAVGVFAFAQVVWLVLARSLPPIASTLSVMMIPVLGVFSGAVGLGEPLHWQDFVAVALMVLAIAAVLAPRRANVMMPWLDLLLAAAALAVALALRPWRASGPTARPGPGWPGRRCCRPSGAPTASSPCRWCSRCPACACWC
jgi:hypothetical protein